MAFRRSRPAAGTGDLTLDPATHALDGPSATKRLTPTEFRLLATLLADAAQQITQAPGRCALEPAIHAAVAAASDRFSTTITTTIDVSPELEVGASREVVARMQDSAEGAAFSVVLPAG